MTKPTSFNDIYTPGDSETRWRFPEKIIRFWVNTFTAAVSVRYIYINGIEQHGERHSLNTVLVAMN